MSTTFKGLCLKHGKCIIFIGLDSTFDYRINGFNRILQKVFYFDPVVAIFTLETAPNPFIRF
jgi:hypothetical protein